MASVPHLPYDRLWQDLSAVWQKVWSARPTVTFVVLLYAAYMVAAKVGEGFSIIPGTNITFWPPAGVMVGMLLVTPRAAWPWLLLTGALGEATANALWFGNPPLHTGLYILGNMLEVSAGALIYAKLAQTPDRVNTLRDSIAFVLSALAAPIAGATVSAMGVGAPLLGALVGVFGGSAAFAVGALGAVASLAIALSLTARAPAPPA